MGLRFTEVRLYHDYDSEFRDLFWIGGHPAQEELFDNELFKDRLDTFRDLEPVIIRVNHLSFENTKADADADESHLDLMAAYDETVEGCYHMPQFTSRDDVELVGSYDTLLPS